MYAIDRIIALSKEQGVSLSSLCKKIDKTRTYLSEIASRRRDVPVEYIPALAEALHTTPEYLKGETDQKEKPADLVVSEQDKEAMDLYSRLTPEQKALVRAQMKGILSNQ